MWRRQNDRDQQRDKERVCGGQRERERDRQTDRQTDRERKTNREAKSSTNLYDFTILYLTLSRYNENYALICNVVITRVGV